MAITIDGTKGLTTSAGLYSQTPFADTFTTGVVLDYTTSLGRVSVGSSAGLAFYGGGVGTTERMRIDTAGNVGIGTSVPAGIVGTGKIFSVYNTSHSTISVQAVDGVNDRYATLELLSSGNGGSYSQIVYGDTDITPGSTSPLVFAGYHNGTRTERMRIDSSGVLMVGATSIVAAGKVGIGFAGNTYNALGLNDTTSTIGCGYIYMQIGGTTIGSIVRVGSGSTVAYNTSSDYRLKENVKPLQNALATVSLLNPVTYNWKADGSKGQGFIAHELQEVVADCVTGVKDAVDDNGNPVYQGMDVSFLVATLTAAIQEQQAIIQQQAADIAALKSKVGI